VWHPKVAYIPSGGVPVPSHHNSSNIIARSQIFALLSCGLFVSEGLITAFFRTSVGQLDEEDSDCEQEKTDSFI